MPNTSGGAASGPGQKTLESSGRAGNIDDIPEEHRRIAAQKLNSLYKRSGKMTADEAYNKAFALGVKEYKRQGSQA